MNFKRIVSLLLFMIAFVLVIPTIHAQTATTKEQKIEVLTPIGIEDGGGGEFYKKGDTIFYSWKQAKSSKKLEISLYGGPKNKTVYKVKRYDGAGINKKLIPAKVTAKLESGQYGILICDYADKDNVVCDGSNGVVIITEDNPLEVATSTKTYEQEIEIKSPNGGEQFYRGENIAYNYHLKKNSKNLLIELVDADKNTVEFSINRYDGWGDNRKTISKKETKKIPTGMYILRICDTSTRVPICDSSDGRISIVDKIPMTKITAIVDKESLKTTSVNPVISGYANDVQLPFYMMIYDLRKDQVWSSGSIVVNNNRWSVTVNENLQPGEYKIDLYSNNVIIKTETLIVQKKQSKEPLNEDTQRQEVETRTEIPNNNPGVIRNPGLFTPQDACKNIPGDQASVPKGWTNVGVTPSGDCKRVEESKLDNDQIKNQEQKIEKVCQVLVEKVITGKFYSKETEWKNVGCKSDTFKKAKDKKKRIIDVKIEKDTQSATENSYLITSDLELGMINESVKTLQKFLNSNGYTVNENAGEPGSVGYETDYFGEKTKQALIKFQSDKGISPAKGYFGQKTRAVMGL